MTKILTVLLLLISSQGLFACSCLYEKVPNKTNIEVEIDNNDWIGIGRVIKEENKNGFLKYILETSFIYKGKQVKNQIVVPGPGDCGFVFETDIEYLVYGLEKENEEIEVSYCSRTIKLDSTADLTLLNHYLRGEKYPNKLSTLEVMFLSRIVKDASIEISEIELFYHDKKLLSKKEFFSLNPTCTIYGFIRLGSGALKRISPEIRNKARNGILIADYGFVGDKINVNKLIRRINRYLKRK